jgi:hypothetical protein
MRGSGFSGQPPRVSLPHNQALSINAIVPSYLHGHSGISRASSRHSGGKGRLRESDVDLIPDTVLPVYSCARAVRFSWTVASKRTGPRVPVVGRRSVLVVKRPRRLTGTSRRPPIRWPQREPGVRRPRVTSGLLEPRPYRKVKLPAIQAVRPRDLHAVRAVGSLPVGRH